MDEQFNISMRKFLKQVGVTSQHAIEGAMRDNAQTGREVTLRMHLTCEEIDLDHVVEGKITVPGQDDTQQ